MSSSTATLRAAQTAVVHLLTVDELELAKLCSTSGVDRFASRSSWSRLPTGEPHYPAGFNNVPDALTQIHYCQSLLLVVHDGRAHVTAPLGPS
jgi:hypothetical protein